MDAARQRAYALAMNIDDRRVRDAFAKHAIAGLLANASAPVAGDNLDAQTVRMNRERYASLARTAFEIADAMLKAREATTK
jgi:hypothetical protein